MSTLINAKPRFGLEGDRLFCYLTSRYVPTSGLLEDGVGVWDLQKVGELIRGDSTIEAAFRSRSAEDELRSVMGQQLELQRENARLLAENQDLGAKFVAAVGEVHRLNDLINAGKSETARPVDKIEETVQAFNAATPPPAEGDKVEQAKADFLSATDQGRPGGDHSATVTAEKQADGSLKVLDVQIEQSGAFDAAAAAMKAKPEDYRPETTRADVEGAMAAQEAPPKGD